MAKRKSKSTLNEPKTESEFAGHTDSLAAHSDRSATYSDSPDARALTRSPKSNKPMSRIRREGDSVIVTVPVKFYRRNGRQMVLAETNEPESTSESLVEANAALIAAIARAYQWQEQLETGQFDTIEDLADSKKVCRGYAARIMRLTSLSPNIVELIIKGEESQNLSLRQLRKGIPDCWKKQIELIRR